MKKIFSLIFCFASLTAFAQITVDDFEGVSKGWGSVEGLTEVQNNAYKTGINLSDHVLYAERAVGAANWAGAILYNYKQTGYNYVHAYMYRSNGNVPNLKIFDTETPVEFVPMNTVVAGQWQDVVFDISEYASRGTDFLFFMVDRANLTETAWMLIDEIQLSNDPTPRTAVVGGNTSPDEYTLVWNEDFTDGSLDGNVWNVEVNGEGGGNNELQYYCEKGVSVGVEPTTGKHCLILTATKEDYNGKGCTSGRVNSKGKMYYTFGKIEARIKFPNTANGLWPAFWQMGNNFDQVGWPKCGETDIIELGHQNGFNGNKQDRYFNGAMHVGSDWEHVWSEANSVTWPYSVEDTFHIVTMIWTPTYIEMYMDKDSHPENNAYFHQDLQSNTNPDYDRSIIFGKPNFVIANLAVGGNFPRIYNVSEITALENGPRSMYIDWIRIYQRGDDNQSFVCPSPSDAIEGEQPTEATIVLETKDQVKKIMHNGQLFIQYGEQIFTITGQRIK